MMADGEGVKKKKRVSKTSKKKAEKDEDERRAEIERRVRKQIAYEKKAHELALKLIEETVTAKMLIDVCQCLNPNHYLDVTEERALAGVCGYPICSKPIKTTLKQKYHISLSSKQVFDVTERKNFCSNSCYKASKYLECQISTSPVWAREAEEPVIFKLLDPETSGTYQGASILQNPRKELEEEVTQIESGRDLGKSSDQIEGGSDLGKSSDNTATSSLSDRTNQSGSDGHPTVSPNSRQQSSQGENKSPSATNTVRKAHDRQAAQHDDINKDDFLESLMKAKMAGMDSLNQKSALESTSMETADSKANTVDDDTKSLGSQSVKKTVRFDASAKDEPEEFKPGVVQAEDMVSLDDMAKQVSELLMLDDAESEAAGHSSQSAASDQGTSSASTSGAATQLESPAEQDTAAGTGSTKDTADQTRFPKGISQTLLFQGKIHPNRNLYSNIDPREAEPLTDHKAQILADLAAKKARIKADMERRKKEEQEKLFVSPTPTAADEIYKLVQSAPYEVSDILSDPVNEKVITAHSVIEPSQGDNLSSDHNSQNQSLENSEVLKDIGALDKGLIDMSVRTAQSITGDSSDIRTTQSNTGDSSDIRTTQSNTGDSSDIRTTQSNTGDSSDIRTTQSNTGDSSDIRTTQSNTGDSSDIRTTQSNTGDSSDIRTTQSNTGDSSDIRTTQSNTGDSSDIRTTQSNTGDSSDIRTTQSNTGDSSDIRTTQSNTGDSSDIRTTQSNTGDSSDIRTTQSNIGDLSDKTGRTVRENIAARTRNDTSCDDSPSSQTDTHISSVCPKNQQQGLVVEKKHGKLTDKFQEMKGMEVSQSKGASKQSAFLQTPRLTPLDLIQSILQEWYTSHTDRFLRGFDRKPGEEMSKEEFALRYAQLGRKVDKNEFEISGQDVSTETGGKAPASLNQLPDMKLLWEDTQKYNLHVSEFFKGSFTYKLAASSGSQQTEDSAKNAQQEGCVQENEWSREPVLPLVDSQAQMALRRRIVLDKLSHAFPGILATLDLSIQEVSSELRQLVHTFNLTSKNITLKPAEWTLMAFMLLQLLALRLPKVKTVLGADRGVTFMSTLATTLGVHTQDFQLMVETLMNAAGPSTDSCSNLETMD